jgi:phosphatidylglycerol---prolipoprotein diacylglyceryl transferase
VWRAKREKLEASSVYGLAAWLFLGGVIGARALFVIQYPETIHSPVDFIRSWEGGNVFYGCIMGGLVGSLIYWSRRPFPFWPMADAVAPALAVGITLGRIGCFLNGCCYGSTCDVPWAVRFPRRAHAWLAQIEQGVLPPIADFSLPVHPTQLYAAFAGAMILAILSAYYPRRRHDGEVMALLMILYPITRWPMESLRGDEAAIFGGMTLSQNISVGLLLLGLAFWVRLVRRPARRHADHVDTSEQGGVLNGPKPAGPSRVVAGIVHGRT